MTMLSFLHVSLKCTTVTTRNTFSYNMVSALGTNMIMQYFGKIK